MRWRTGDSKPGEFKIKGASMAIEIGSTMVWHWYTIDGRQSGERTDFRRHCTILSRSNSSSAIFCQQCGHVTSSSRPPHCQPVLDS
jgi:hypothetical protein